MAKGMSVTPVALDPLVSEETRRIFSWICYGVVCQIIDIFGAVTNIINIICFVRQGFSDPINISLLGLAISDLGSLVTLIFTNICFIPAFQDADLPFNSIDFQHLTTGWMHVMFTRVTSWITALITLERCLCITMPLKVRNMITPKRVTIAIVSVYIIIIGGNSPMYVAYRLDLKYSPAKNKTVIGLVFTDDRVIAEQISYAVSNVLIPLTAFLTVIVCTTVLVIKLRQKTKWRQKSTGAAIAEITSERDQKVTKMVVMISTLFIACFVPISLTFIAMLIEPGLAVDGQYFNTLFVVAGVAFILESTNSATNIFIYYHMSSRYRKAFRQLFGLEQKQ